MTSSEGARPVVAFGRRTFGVSVERRGRARGLADSFLGPHSPG
jgi:hypothetical protein